MMTPEQIAKQKAETRQHVLASRREGRCPWSGGWLRKVDWGGGIACPVCDCFADPFAPLREE